METPSSSSKVTVEYFDPYGVYPLLSPGLLPRLPLRNLHWESHSGPLRSISSLHIDLVPSAQDARPTSSLEAAASTSSLSRVKSEESTASGDDGFRTQALGAAVAERPQSVSATSKVVVKERRHQIPGLRQTPYLKVFFLRCDDGETYKTRARQEVRGWIKEHTPPAQSTSKSTPQENHDAFEWLIVHVIVPNTAAATQPRTSGKSAEGSSTSVTEKTTNWRGKSSSTILDKLKADFNGSSRSATDRVAQIRIGINDVPYDMLPRVVPAIPGSYTETPQENEAAWADLIAKLKFLILTSFDMRVSQYEEDIREKDAQRTLPGWNFCTFFVLKEGLARGFESVGLVEDALVGYDELSVGLDAIVREQSLGTSRAALSFLPFTEDLKREAEATRNIVLNNLGIETIVETDDPIDLQSGADVGAQEDDEIPVSASKKRYRELILSNDISVFDFRCYVFARQLSMLLRLANVSSSREELLAKLKEQRESSLQGVVARLPPAPPSDDAEDLQILAEICKRSMDFIASIGHIMRHDLWTSFVPLQEKPDGETQGTRDADTIVPQVVDNMVSSFTFSVVQQILAQTSTKALPIPPSTLAPPSSKIGLDGQEQKAAIPEPKTMMHPARSSSLALRSASREPPSPNLFPGGRRASVPEGTASSPFLKTGLEQLAAHRAELYYLSRNILETAGKRRGWSAGWDEIVNLKNGKVNDMEDIDLNEDTSSRSEDLSNHKIEPFTQGVRSKLLGAAIDNKEDFYRLYETLTDKALRHYTVANHMQSVLSSMSDLAILKYYLQDYAAAASYFYRMTPFYGDGGWTHVELSMLVMYAKCLRELQRKEEFVRVVLKLLSKAAAVEKEMLTRKSAFSIGGPGIVQEELVPVNTYLLELLEVTKSLQHEVRAPLQDFFGHVEVDGTVRYHPEMDSVGLQLRLQYLLPDELHIEKAKVRMAPLSGDATREIWLETEEPAIFRKGIVKISLQSNVIIPGTYVVNYISLHASNITFWHDHGNKGPTTSKSDTFFKSPKLLVYHRPESFNAKLIASRYMHLDRNRALELILSPGWNQVISGELHVRAATAGLRLQTSEAKVVNGPLEISKKSEAGIIRFGAVEKKSSSKLVIPYNLEHEVNGISLKLEISYITEKGTFFFATLPSVSIMLPLGVNVQDVFKHKALFSKFTIASASSSPLRLLRIRLENSEVFKAEGGTILSKPLTIFPRQPASMLYKITKLGSAPIPVPSTPKQNKKALLSLVLNYTCLEEEIENAVTQDLDQALESNPLHPYTQLIIHAVIAELLGHLSPYDLEHTAVLEEVSTAGLASIRWRDHFSGLGRTPNQKEELSIKLEEFLQEWQRRRPAIPLLPITINEETISKSRSIIIPVDIPSVTVVHTADLKLVEPSPLATVVAALNQPISTNLTIKWTRIWDNKFSLDGTCPAQTTDLDFFYEISAASDTWLIGGKRKGHFKVPRKIISMPNNHKLTFPIILIPLREGYLPFPEVVIKPAPVAKVLNASGVEEGLKHQHVSCETDFKNSAETIRVISDAKKTTVSLDASGPQGGAWLLGSERRELGSGGVLSS